MARISDPRARRRLAVGLACAAAAGLAAVVLQRPPVAVAPPLQTAASRADELADGPPEPATDVLVRFEREAGRAERSAARRAADVDLERPLPLPGLQLVRPQRGVPVSRAIARLERSDDVVYAEPDVARSIFAVPSDRLFNHQWGLHNVGQAVGGTAGVVDADIDAPEAWDSTTGAAGVTVAVVDSGVQTDHPDLAPNLWTNPGESGEGREANGVDDDASGYADDLHGWDFVGGDADPGDGNGHGTHVAGTVGAVGNDGQGVTGVAWRVGLLPLRVLADDGSGRVSDVVRAYALADRLGVRIVNASLGGSDFSRSEHDAIRAASSTLFVVAAGNEGADNDTNGSYPCNYELANVVCVAAVGKDGALAGFSNRGERTVDLAAPGVDVASTWPESGWALLDGTSMAAPHVAGVAALAWSLRPNAEVAEVRDALLATAQPHPSLIGVTVTGGTVNAERVLAAVAPEAAPSATSPSGEDAPAEPAPASGPRPAGPDAPAEPGEAPPAPLTDVSGAAPGVAPGVAPDSEPPSVEVSVGRLPRVSGLLRRGLVVRVTCSERCTLRSRLLLPARTARRLALGSGDRDVRLARARGGTTGAATTRLRLRVAARGERRLRRPSRLSVRLVVRATDVAGNARVVRRLLRLRR